MYTYVYIYNSRKRDDKNLMPYNAFALFQNSDCVRSRDSDDARRACVTCVLMCSWNI